MKIIGPIVKFYDFLYKSDINDQIIKTFNVNEKLLFNKIISGDVNNDKQASKLLYDGNPSSQTYAKFKQAFISKLIQITVNFPNHLGSQQRQKVLNLHKEFYAYNVMLNSSMKETSMKLAKKLIVQAERLHQYELGISLAKELAVYNSISLKNKFEANKYWEKYELFDEKFNNLILFVKNYSELTLLANEHDYNEALNQKAEELLSFLEHKICLDNPKVMQYYFQMNYIKYASIIEHQGVIENNLNALKYFNALPHEYQAVKDLIRVQLIFAYIGLGEYEEAVNFLEESTIEVGDEKWIQKMYLKTKIYFNLQKFDKTNELIESIVSSIRFKQSMPVMQKRFWLFKYYNDLMNFYQTGENVKTRIIRNNMTRLISTKKNTNIPFVIAEIIEKLQSSGVSELYNHIDQLTFYLNGILKDGNHKRTIIFLSFLRSLPDSKYDPKKFIHDLEEYYRQLEENPGESIEKSEIEIIPYEALMEIILKNHVNQRITQGINLTFRGSSVASAASDN